LRLNVEGDIAKKKRKVMEDVVSEALVRFS
jgi:hypothetical protein